MSGASWRENLRGLGDLLALLIVVRATVDPIQLVSTEQLTKFCYLKCCEFTSYSLDGVLTNCELTCGDGRQQDRVKRRQKLDVRVIANRSSTTLLGSVPNFPDKNLLKEDFSTVPVWIKLNGVPVMAFIEDGLSAIATKLGTSLMLDSYTSDMCMQSWGRSSYARVMIELRADVELKDNIVVV
ncbi:hypothetical protein Tco_0708634 [Tanacetum coccineum]